MTEMKTQQVANTVRWLCSDAAAAVAGRAIRIPIPVTVNEVM